MSATICHKCELAVATAVVDHCTACQRRRVEVCDDCRGYSPHCARTRGQLLRALAAEERLGRRFDPEAFEECR